MEPASIVFQFQDGNQAKLAWDTYNDLGYSPVMFTDTEQPSLKIHIDKCDLTSALEIAFMHGGELITSSKYNDLEIFSMAYEFGEEFISIPAHIVNEDIIHDEMTKDTESKKATSTEEEDEMDESLQSILSDQDQKFDHFSADVRA
ncbi:hypothetical protein [Longirhabdus pacifica]|uniref:hypothetical protein n=1 Tax=Longirhabdus pacifica TaxID=2305227 RepID=UPI0010090CB3|nr:hypothetical protein [Longirhabdus pacifica]